MLRTVSILSRGACGPSLLENKAESLTYVHTFKGTFKCKKILVECRAKNDKMIISGKIIILLGTQGACLQE